MCLPYVNTPPDSKMSPGLSQQRSLPISFCGAHRGEHHHPHKRLSMSVLLQDPLPNPTLGSPVPLRVLSLPGIPAVRIPNSAHLGDGCPQGPHAKISPLWLPSKPWCLTMAMPEDTLATPLLRWDRADAHTCSRKALLNYQIINKSQEMKQQMLS